MRQQRPQEAGGQVSLAPARLDGAPENQENQRPPQPQRRPCSQPGVAVRQGPAHLSAARAAPERWPPASWIPGSLQAGELPQLGQQLRQLYASATSLATAAAGSQDPPPSYQNIPGVVPYYQGRQSGPPPSYDEVINPCAAPPSYQSLFGQIRQARKSSRGLLDLASRLSIILVSTIGCTLLIGCMILLPFTMIIVGAVYIDECRVEHIPAFLLVGGLVWAAKNTVHVYNQCQQPAPGAAPPPAAARPRPSNGPSSNGSAAAPPPPGGQPGGSTTQTTRRARRLRGSLCEALLNCLLFAWFLAGCVIVLRNYEPDFENPKSFRYCNRTVYLYAFWLITSVIFLSSAFIGCVCCLIVSSAIVTRHESPDESPAAA